MVETLWLTTPRLRTLLAVLARSAGRPVPIEGQAAALWDDDPPDNARRNVQTYPARLRRVLGASAIGAGPDGYRLHAEPDRVDALRFVRLLNETARTSDASAERALLAEALQPWPGAPFEGMRSSWLERSEAPRLLERYLAAVERRIDIDVALGQPGELTAELSELIDETSVAGVTARCPPAQPWSGGRPARVSSSDLTSVAW